MSVGVLVDLFLGPEGGGHVHAWTELARAARNEDLDLTVYFLSNEPKTVSLAPNVRFILTRPLVSTASFRFLRGVASHTDLAPFRPGLFRRLGRHHVIHSTDAYFSMARTAMAASRLRGRPLVHSVHTDTPSYTKLYADQILHRILGSGLLSRLFCDRLRLDARLERRMLRRLERYAARCDWVFTSPRIRPLNGHSGEAWSILRRGIDLEAFHPRHARPAELRRRLGLDGPPLLFFFAGRIDAGKSVRTLVEATRRLAAEGVPCHAVLAGTGSEVDEMRRLLARNGTLLGSVGRDDMPLLYASSDLFVFPSRIEVSPNVVLEAKASGLPVLVSAVGGSSQFVERAGVDGIVIEKDEAGAWAEVLRGLASSPATRRDLGLAAREHVERTIPSWSRVLREDLLPVWRQVARRRGVWN